MSAITPAPTGGRVLAGGTVAVNASYFIIGGDSAGGGLAAAQGTVTVSGINALLTAATGITVGNNGTGDLQVLNGGSVSLTGAGTGIGHRAGRRRFRHPPGVGWRRDAEPRHRHDGHRRRPVRGRHAGYRERRHRRAERHRGHRCWRTAAVPVCCWSTGRTHCSPKAPPAVASAWARAVLAPSILPTAGRSS